MSTTDPRELLRSMNFYRPQPSPVDTIEDMLSIGFRHDGSITVGAGTDSPVRLAQRLRELFAALVEHPEIVEEAAGIHGAAFHLIGEPLRRLDNDEV